MLYYSNSQWVDFLLFSFVKVYFEELFSSQILSALISIIKWIPFTRVLISLIKNYCKIIMTTFAKHLFIINNIKIILQGQIITSALKPMLTKFNTRIGRKKK